MRAAAWLLPVAAATSVHDFLTASYGWCGYGTASCTCTAIGPHANAGLTGTIPTQLMSCTQLTDLFLYENAITGTIPAEIGLLTSLANLYFHTNSINGTIPAEIGALTQLTHMCAPARAPAGLGV